MQISADWKAYRQRTTIISQHLSHNTNSKKFGCSSRFLEKKKKWMDFKISKKEKKILDGVQISKKEKIFEYFFK